MTCDQPLDVVLLIDGSGSLGEAGWKAEITAAKTFVDAFTFAGQTSKAQISVILYSGPRTWSGVDKCFGLHGHKPDMEKDCHIKVVAHLTNDMAAVKEKISKLVWPRGSTLTSLALLSAHSELMLGRADSKSVVVAITDGRPLSYKKTSDAARFVRKDSRLLWVPVTRHAPLWQIKKWGTRRWEENVVEVPDFVELESPDVVTHIIADICPLM